MIPELHTAPTDAEIKRTIARAHQMRAEMFRAAFRTFVHWIAHPSLHPQHT